MQVAVALEHRTSPSLSHPPAGFSTLAQLKRRNTLKDGIIMIQTLLIIIFIIVPIFLLLDKVTSGGQGGSHRAGRFLQSAPHPRPLTPHASPRPISLAPPGLAQWWTRSAELTFCSLSLAPPG